MAKRNSEQEIQSELRELAERVRSLRQELEQMTARGRNRIPDPQAPVLPMRRKLRGKPRPQ